MIHGIKIEICCGTIEDCICANEFEVDRLELNCALELGGLTPTVTTLKMANGSLTSYQINDIQYKA